MSEATVSAMPSSILLARLRLTQFLLKAIEVTTYARAELASVHLDDVD